MKHIPIKKLLNEVFQETDGMRAKQRLERAHIVAAGKDQTERKTYIDQNGSTKWSPLKNCFTEKLGNKCWYTEAEVVGASLTIDHYRPQCDYWFLAFTPDNYRVACPFANSPKHNPLHGCSGGKGDSFPLLDERNKAHGSKRIRNERPVILDPCKAEDCNLIAFQADGRPVIHPDYASDPVAIDRLERSKLLLNLDHPDFNSKREQLHDAISDAVADHEAFPEGSSRRERKRNWIKDRISTNAPFSVAARHYLRAYIYLDWVENMIDQDPS